MNVGDKLDAIRLDLRALAKQCIDNDDDDCCSISLLAAAEAVTYARNKLATYGLDECDAPASGPAMTGREP